MNDATLVGGAVPMDEPMPAGDAMPMTMLFACKVSTHDGVTVVIPGGRAGLGQPRRGRAGVMMMMMMVVMVMMAM